MIAKHLNYSGMPGAFSEDGKPIWQVSSGKTTSFYQFFELRQNWWTAKADTLGLPGKGKELDRWTVAARIIHPTGIRDCLICGERKNIGYFYVNKRLADRLNHIVRKKLLEPQQSVSEVLVILKNTLDRKGIESLLMSLFPERKSFFEKHGYVAAAFEKSNYIRTAWLSPGFMGDPPYRFDGLHDYCTSCRKSNDPGRSDKNMQTYSHDRRAFEWWAEGNWNMADALFKKAGAGICALCNSAVDKVSPDHIGPLACGFKHIPFFRPTCKACNSSKNRRMSLQDVRDLVAYENKTGRSPASWQARSLWDHFKAQVTSNGEAEELSALLRAVQDLYLRCLYALCIGGRARFLRTLLRPDFALRDYTFEDLDTAELTFSKVVSHAKDTNSRRSLAVRSVRIAFDELATYVVKDIGDRRVRQTFSDSHPEIISAIVTCAEKYPLTELDRAWDRAIRGPHPNNDARENAIASLLNDEKKRTYAGCVADTKLREVMLQQFAGLIAPKSL